MKKRVLSLLLALMMIVSLVPTAAMAFKSDTDVAYAVTGGNIYFNESTGTITDCDTSVTEAIIPSEINGVAVTGIGDGAFYYCDSLTAITIPNSVTRIGAGVFSNCDSLTRITIPDGVTSIGGYAFHGCSSLTTITIPSSVTSIGNCAFSGCSSLTSVSIPDSVTNIENFTFSECSSLTSVTIPGSVTSIGVQSFCDCSSLMTVIILNGVTSIGDSAFSGCSSLTSITIPDSVTSIGDYAFSGCRSLTSVTIPDSVTSIGGYAFHGGWEIDIAFAGTNEAWASISMGEDAFWGSPRIHYNCSSLDGHYILIERKDTSCTSEGYAKYLCDCGYEYTETLPIVHDYVLSDSFEPTCTAHGYDLYKCSKCGIEKIDTKNDELKEHDYVITIVGPTCTTGGYTIHTCAVCGNSYKDTLVPYLGHSMVEVSEVPATCTVAGHTAGVQCSRCGTIDSGMTEIAATGHDYKAKVTAPTCIEKGYTTHTCTNCGDSYVDNYTDALGHDDQIENEKAATCTEDGYTGDVVCKRCGEVIGEGPEIEALGHDYKNGKCTRCGAADPNYKAPTAVTFSDVAAKAYYANAVQWAVENKITKGTDDTHFSPDQGCTRAQVVTFLWRAAGSPTVSGDAGFVDVKSTDYYYDAVKWAVANGITNGTDATHFSPSATCTRAQVVTFMYRAEGSPATSGSCGFVDVKSSDYYYNAVIWAVANEITNGTDATHFSPSATCTRAQVVTFLYRNAQK